MGGDLRHRKNKSSKTKSKDHKAHGNEEDPDILSKLKELSRDSGDGDSAPDTPPPEFDYRSEEFSRSVSEAKNKTQPVPSKATTKTPKQQQTRHDRVSTGKDHLTVPLSFQLDGVSLSLFILTLSTRLWKLEIPRGIVFDELHFGKYASMYMKNTFFFDSQPPLGKQLVALAAYFAGFNGNFTFDRIGSPYDEHVPVAALRFVPALFGSLVPPVAYNLFMELGLSQFSGILAALLLIFDNAMLAQSRFVLMEPMLLFFGLFGLVCVTRVRRLHKRPFSVPWFGYLVAGLFSLSAGFCVRYFGFFTLALGLALLSKDFWSVVADRTVSDMKLLIHFLVRAFFVVAVPVSLYLAVFYAHLNILYKAGPNDNIMTSAFQASLEGGLASIIANQPVKIVHGSQITMRHTHGKTCWLHSHDDVYPVKYADDRGSSHQQQVTCYSYKDVNNWWIVKKPENDELVVREPKEPIRDGDIVQLVHGLTSRSLNSHDVASAMSPYSQEVSCYIDYNVSMPAQNFWKIDLMNKEATGGFWHAVESQVRLVHVNTSTVLRFSGRQLPDWGFRQHEIVADKSFDHDDAVWNVEEHRYTSSEDQKEREKELMRTEMIPTERKNMSFFDKLFELQYKMIFNNQENVAGHTYASEPLDWLTLNRGVAYWIEGGGSNAQVHFLGNVVIWLSGTASIVLFATLFVFYLLRRQRACFDIPETEWNKLCDVAQIFLGGYLVNYIPYFAVDRTLFLHHYLPAYMFKVFILASVVDHGYFLARSLTRNRLVSRAFVCSVAGWFALALYTFVRFAPLTYGDASLTGAQINDLTWRNTWDFILVQQ